MTKTESSLCYRENCYLLYFFSVMQDQSDDSFTKVLQQNYGKPPTESKFMSLFQVLFPFLASFN